MNEHPLSTLRDMALGAAIKAYADGAYYPFGTIIPRNEAEFDFCDADDESALAVKVRPIYVEPKCIGNFVVWERGEPERWWRWDATHDAVLGMDALFLAQRRAQPIQLVGTPERWAELVGDCCCVLDWNADLRSIFGDVVVACESPELEKVYARRWRGRKWGPRIAKRETESVGSNRV